MLSSPVEDKDDGNILINFNDLHSFLSPKLAICAQCRKCKPEIIKLLVSGFCTGLEVTCQHCTVIETQQRRQQRHLQDKLCLTRGNEREKIGRQFGETTWKHLRILLESGKQGRGRLWNSCGLQNVLKAQSYSEM